MLKRGRAERMKVFAYVKHMQKSGNVKAPYVRAKHSTYG